MPDSIDCGNEFNIIKVIQDNVDSTIYTEKFNNIISFQDSDINTSAILQSEEYIINTPNCDTQLIKYQKDNYNIIKISNYFKTKKPSINKINISTNILSYTQIEKKYFYFKNNQENKIDIDANCHFDNNSNNLILMDNSKNNTHNIITADDNTKTDNESRYDKSILDKSDNKKFTTFFNIHYQNKLSIIELRNIKNKIKNTVIYNKFNSCKIKNKNIINYNQNKNYKLNYNTIKNVTKQQFSELKNYYLSA